MRGEKRVESTMIGYEPIGMTWGWLGMGLAWLVPIILAALLIHLFTEPHARPQGQAEPSEPPDREQQALGTTRHAS
jgi:hypothetical protein